VLNIIYFWITDSYLKAGKEHTGAHHNEEEKEAVGEAVTPYYQMGAAGDVSNGAQHSSSKGNGALV
jgi:hypothetical protein